MTVPGGKAPTSAAAVANEFLELGRHEPGVPAIDQMKLQKLLFYAQAWYLAQAGGPLFEEDFEAWPWGPVVRDIYNQTRAVGRAPVSNLLTQLAGSPGTSILDFSFITPKVTDQAIKEYLRSVWDSHKRFTGVQLSNASHLPGEPWTIVKDKYGSLDGKPTIPTDLISAVYKQKLVNAVSSTPASK